jgi:hypothetical protein
MEKPAMEILNVVAIIVAGLMVGNELAIAAFVHPTLWSAAGCGPSTSGLGSSGPHLACDRDHRAVAYAMLALTLIPILDGIVVFKHADWNFKPAILIHWGTAAVMLVIVELLRSGM